MTRVPNGTVAGFPAVALLFAGLAGGCISASSAAQAVRTTSNPEVVHGCTFLGNVRATSMHGGAAGSGIAAHNTDVTLREKAAKLGGNVVFVVASGIHGSGEAYRCPEGERP